MCTFAALMSSSERHSAMDLMFLKAASLAPVQRSQIAWRGENSTFICMNYWRVTDEREHSRFRGKKCLHHLLSNNVGNKTSLSCWEPSTLSDHHSPTWLTLLRGDTSTAWRLTVPALPMRVESSRGPELMIAFTTTFDKHILIWLALKKI